MFEQERGRIYQRDGDCRGWWDQPARYLKDQGYDFPDRYEQQEDQERQAVGDQPFAVIAFRERSFGVTPQQFQKLLAMPYHPLVIKVVVGPWAFDADG